ncbi:MAG: glycerophosphoryl diester phosphodiesterase membrane domain-containing protein [Gemmatimonadota bacterium]|nr:MAG: glycerophosphoryl diester phosphodiesterase membrane domain-containing protein [Gemmatimonadota bacterium]
MKDTTVGGLFSRTWRDFRLGFVHFLAYDLAVKVVGAAIVVPVSSWAVTLALGFAGQIGLIAMASRALTGGRVSALEALRITARKLPTLLGLGALQAALYCMALAPFAALAGIAYLLIPLRHDINYIITARPPVFWAMAAIAAVLLAGAAVAYLTLYLRWVFSVPALLFDGAGPFGALRRSARLIRGSWRRVGIVLLAWGLVLVVGPLILTRLLDLSAESVLTRLGTDLGPVIGAVVLLVVVYALAMETVTLVGLSVNGLLITHLYYRLRAERGTTLPELPTARAGPRVVRLGRWPKGRLVAAAAAVGLAIAAVSTYAALGRLELDRQVAVTAHRGSSKRAPENTLSGIEAAIEDGAEYAEIDVQETADGVIVLLHDEDLMRVAGVDRKIWHITHAELADVDVGGLFAPHFAGERLPTLREAIAVARGRIKLNIELKFNGHNVALAERVVEILEDEGFTTAALVSSLRRDGLLKVRALNPSLQTGYMIYQARGDVARLDVDFLSLSKRLVTRDLVRSVQGAGKEVHVWTVDDPRRMSALIDLGVDNITTNEPAALRAVIEARMALSDAEKLVLAFGNWLRE